MLRLKIPGSFVTTGSIDAWLKFVDIADAVGQLIFRAVFVSHLLIDLYVSENPRHPTRSRPRLRLRKRRHGFWIHFEMHCLMRVDKSLTPIGAFKI